MEIKINYKITINLIELYIDGTIHPQFDFIAPIGIPSSIIRRSPSPEKRSLFSKKKDEHFVTLFPGKGSEIIGERKT